MELTLDQALQKGIEAHKAGKVQEANYYYSAVLKAQAKHPDANHNKGDLVAGIGKIKEALPFFKVALKANPRIANFLFETVPKRLLTISLEILLFCQSFIVKTCSQYLATS